MNLRVDRIALSILSGACGIWLIAGAIPASADQLTLTNGDRLSGKVVSIDVGKLVFKTDMFGEVKVPVENIAAIATDDPVAVQFKEGGSVTGRLYPSESGAIRLIGPNETSSSFDLAAVKAIHPGAELPVFTWEGHANVGLSHSNGNSNIESYHVDAQTIGRGVMDRITLGAEFNREKSDELETANNGKLSAQFDRFISRAWYVYVAGSGERDEFQDLKLRTTAGTGAGYQIIDTNRTQLSFEAGPTYVNEDFETAPDEEFFSGRWATKYSMWTFDKLAQLFHNHEGIVNLENSNDVLFQTRSGVRIPVRDSLNVTAQVNWDYDNEPAPGNEKTDTKYILSVGYHW